MKALLLLSLLVSTLAALTTVMVYQRIQPLPPQVVVIDPAALVAEQLHALTPGLDEAQIQAHGRAFAARLDKAVGEVAQQHNAVILVGPAVIHGAPDLTEAVRRRLNETP